MTELVLKMCLALTLAAGGAAVGVSAWNAVHEGAVETLSEVQKLNDAQTVRAGQIARHLETGAPLGQATEEDLVRDGYLVPEFQAREKVSTEPLELPEVTNEEDPGGL